MDAEQLKIPANLDEPPRYFIFTKGQLAFITLPTLGGYLGFQGLGLLFGLGFGLTIVKILKGLKMRHGKNFLLRWCYWNLPQRFLIYNMYAALPKSYIREFIG